MQFRMLLLKAFENFSNHLAIEDDKTSLSYQELFQWCHIKAKLLENLMLHKGDIIVIIGQKSTELLSLILACIFKEVIFIICEENISEFRWYQIAKQCQVKIVYDLRTGIKYSEPLAENRCQLNTILIYYTSGSTGKPKAIQIHETNICNFLQWAITTFNLCENDRFCSFAPWYFDLSVLDIFAALLSGGSIHCVPQQIKIFPNIIANWLKENKITIIYMVPTALIALQKQENFSHFYQTQLRCILFAGEHYPISDLSLLRQKFPAQIIANLYGPTETNVCSYYILPANFNFHLIEKLSIGNPITNTKLYVINEHGQKITKLGQIGELVCAGTSNLSRYLNVENDQSFFNADGVPSYKTGDLVRIDHAGLILIGRKDKQIKYRGNRIDICEIEAVLRKFDGIIQAGVCMVENDLVGFVSGNIQLSKIRISQHCKKFLPYYCCPSKIMIMDKLPLTRTEKIDYNELVYCFSRKKG